MDGITGNLASWIEIFPHNFEPSFKLIKQIYTKCFQDFQLISLRMFTFVVQIKLKFAALMSSLWFRT